MVNIKKILIFVVLVFGLVQAALAENRYIVGRSTSIYEGPSRDFKSDRHYNRGQTVDVEENCEEGFCRVKLGADIGYVLRSALIDWQLVGRVGSTGEGVSAEKPKRWQFRFEIIESYLQEAAHDIQTSLNSTYSLSAFKGLNTNFAIGVEYAKDINWSWLAGLIYRRVDTEGDSVETGTTLTNRFRLEQTFVGGTAGVRYYLSHHERWSMSGNLEYSKGQSIKLVVLQGPAIDSSGLKLPLYVIATGGLGYTMPLMSHYSLELGLRAGAVMTTIPATVVAEGLVALRF